MNRRNIDLSIFPDYTCIQNLILKMCELLSLPLMSIGKELGDRNHTTILYSRDKVEGMMAVSDKMAKDIDDIKNIILKK